LLPKILLQSNPEKSFPHKDTLLKSAQASLNGTTFTAVTFDGRDYFLKVIDQKEGPGTEFARAEFAGQGSLAAINGGFFNPDGSPLGLVITDGQSRGVFNASSFLGTGIIDGENTTLSDRKSYQESSELLQSGPRLVWIKSASRASQNLKNVLDPSSSGMVTTTLGLAMPTAQRFRALPTISRLNPLKGFISNTPSTSMAAPHATSGFRTKFQVEGLPKALSSEKRRGITSPSENDRKPVRRPPIQSYSDHVFQTPSIFSTAGSLPSKIRTHNPARAHRPS
jgi:hypothetical protein